VDFWVVFAGSEIGGACSGAFVMLMGCAAVLPLIWGIGPSNGKHLLCEVSASSEHGWLAFEWSRTIKLLLLVILSRRFGDFGVINQIRGLVVAEVWNLVACPERLCLDSRVIPVPLKTTINL